jgi:hypothetical protein
MADPTKNEMAIPEHLKAVMAQQAEAGSNADADSLASASVSIPRISLKGKKFRFIEGGEEISKHDSIKVVILGVEPEAGRMIKTYYEGAYNPSDNAPPTCSSSDGVAPDLWVQDPQAERCSSCPKNVFGSATSTTGKKAKACRDAKRIWVTEPEKVKGTVFGLNIPVTSLRALSDYGNFIRKNNFPLAGVITELSMDEDAEFPQVLFAHAGFLNEAQFNQAFERNQTKDWLVNIPRGPLLEDRSEASKPKPKLADMAAAAADVVGDADTGPYTEKVEKDVSATIDEKVGNW